MNRHVPAPSRRFDENAAMQRTTPRHVTALVGLLAACAGVLAQTGMQPLGRFEIDLTEVTIGQFRKFVEATGLKTAAERAGGGSTFEAGWEQRKGWTWRSPFGQPGGDYEPAVHVTYGEAQAFCQWAAQPASRFCHWKKLRLPDRRQPAGRELPGRLRPGAHCHACNNVARRRAR